MIDRTKASEDVPAPIAIFLLALVIAGLTIGGDQLKWEHYAGKVEDLLADYPELVACSLSAVCLNALAAYLIIQTWLSYRQQGRRLRELTGEGRQSYIRLVKAAGSIACLSVIFFFCIQKIDVFAHEGSLPLPTILVDLIAANLALALAIVCQRLWIFGRWICLAHRAWSPLAEPKSAPNRLILGTTMREEPCEKL